MDLKLIIVYVALLIKNMHKASDWPYQLYLILQLQERKEGSYL